MKQRRKVTDQPIGFRVISLGAGVQSTALYLMALDGLIHPRPDVAIFADTQQEPPWVYENLHRLAKEGQGKIPIYTPSYGDLLEAVRRKSGKGEGRFASVPFFVKNKDGSRGIGRRQCTREYKIDVVKKEIRRLLGVGYKKHCKVHVEEWVGISLDEASRMKPSRTPWITTRWPLLFDVPMHRKEIKAWLDERGWGGVGKSACIFCPFRSKQEWARWRAEHPDLFEAACQVDDMIRYGGSSRGLRGEQYILDSLTPLRDLPEDAQDSGHAFDNECEGMCGV